MVLQGDNENAMHGKENNGEVLALAGTDRP